MTTDETTPAQPLVGVVTVSYASDDVLPALLASVPAAAGEATEVIVVDNLPSVGESARIAGEHGATYVPLPENPGYGGAMNAGVAHLSPSVEWILIVNPDVALDTDSIARLAAFARSHDDVGAVGPLIRNADGTPYPSARAVPSLRTGVGHAMLGPLWPGNPWTRAYRLDSDEAPSLRDAGWLSGACLLVRRSTFEQIGGFDDEFFMYFEDVDLGVRISRAGFRNVYQPAAAVMHEGGHSTSRASERMIIAHHDSARRFLSKKYPGPLLWPIRAALSLGLKLRGALAIRRSRREPD